MHKRIFSPFGASSVTGSSTSLGGNFLVNLNLSLTFLCAKEFAPLWGIKCYWKFNFPWWFGESQSFVEATKEFSAPLSVTGSSTSLGGFNLGNVSLHKRIFSPFGASYWKFNFPIGE